MKKTQSPRTRTRRYRGFTTLVASLLVLSLCAMPVVNSFRTDIDKFLGTSSTKRVTSGEIDTASLYTYATDYANTTELVQGIRDLGEQMNEEGSVLLKNNGALPLSSEEISKVSLMGFSSYYPVMGGDMGSMLSINEGTDADTVDFVQALTQRGYSLNPILSDVYTNDTIFSEWTDDKTREGSIKAPTQTGTFSSKEPSIKVLDGIDKGWKDSLSDYNVMVVTLARSSGENRTYLPGEEGVNPDQNLNQADPLGLSDSERDLIQAAADAKKESNGKVIVILNNANPMEIEELKQNPEIDAILQIGLPGGYGFYGVADILSGAANPSGHLTDTYAVDISNAPSSMNYGNFEYTNADANNCINSSLVEAEGIYIGYKYYETRYIDSVLGQGNATSTAGSSTGKAWEYDQEVSYPFGYGLSYTTFDQTLDQLDVDLENKQVTAQVTVTNTGKIAGKDAVQLYVSLPYTDYDKEHKVEKAGIQLLDYGKTAELAPGESQTLTITADMQYMTSWDSTASNEAGTTGCYILDAGTYYFAIGDDVHDAANHILTPEEGTVSTWELADLDTTSFALTKNGTPVENQLEDLDLNYWMEGTVTYLTRSDWEATWPITYKDLTATDEMLAYLDNDTYEITDNGDPSSVVFGEDNNLTLADLRGNMDLEDEKWSQLMDQLSLEDAMKRIAFGGVSTKAMNSISSPEAVQNDGPNGIYSYPLGQYANYDQESGDPCAIGEEDKNKDYVAGVMANETVVAQTFSKELAQAFGAAMGNYSLWSNLPIYWGCGTNIHRSPYNARNHEYYSEDPVLSSFQGAAFVEAGLKYGCLIAPKHLAFNDTEINRIGISTFMTEQQARENELRCFQSSFEDAKALAAMSAFNRVGVTACNSHEGLIVNILRNEWGFEGLISEDCIPQANYCVLKEAAVNYVSMTCKTGDDTMAAVSEKWNYWTPENVSRDEKLLSSLKQGMTYMAFALANSNALDGIDPTSRLVPIRTWYDNLLTALQCLFGVLFLLCILGYVKARKKECESSARSINVAGLVWNLLTILVIVVAAVFYFINCHTDYFTSFGMNPIVLFGMAMGILLEIIIVVTGRKRTSLVQDVLPVLAAAVLMMATVFFLGSRITEAAFIMTFQKNANTLADLTSAIIGIVCCLVATICCIIASFMDVTKE